jgi:hypothetical protein
MSIFRALMKYSCIPLAIAIPMCLATAQTTAPQLISKIDPQPSEEARRAGVQGSVTLSIVINEDGAAEDIKVLRGAGFGLERARHRSGETVAI